MRVRPAFGRVDVEALLAELRRRPFNYRSDEAHTKEAGWHLDLERTVLPSEEPGDPEPGGTWEVAREIVRDYEFVDRELVRGYYDRTEPLARRTMVLELRLWTLRLLVGVRVTDVHDQTRELEGRHVRSWGWTYGTLEGHVEAGERTYEVRKWLDTGEVEFVTTAFSRPASGNPLVRLGFQLLGRPRQDRFVAGVGERTAELVAAALAGRLVRPPDETLAARPAAAPD